MRVRIRQLRVLVGRLAWLWLGCETADAGSVSRQTGPARPLTGDSSLSSAAAQMLSQCSD